MKVIYKKEKAKLNPGFGKCLDFSVILSILKTTKKMHTLKELLFIFYYISIFLFPKSSFISYIFLEICIVILTCFYFIDS